MTVYLKTFFITLFSCALVTAIAQDDYGTLQFIGRNFFNNIELSNTKIKVVSGENTIKELTTKESNKFSVDLAYGKTYDIYLMNPKCQTMFIRVFADIPEKKRFYNITYELRIPFFEKNASNIDTMNFKNPFHQIVFDGKARFIDDEAYEKLFIKNLYKKQSLADTIIKIVAPLTPPIKEKKLIQLVGKLCLDNDKQTPLKNKTVSLIDKEEKVISTVQSSNSGKFVFVNVDSTLVSGIYVLVDSKDNPNNHQIKLRSNRNMLIDLKTYANNEVTVFKNTNTLNIIGVLADNDFKYSIAGKLVTTNSIETKVASNKSVLLLEDTVVIQKTRTDALGNFVFPLIKPGQSYNIGYETSDCESGFKMDLYSTKDKFIKHLDSLARKKFIYKLLAISQSSFNDLLIEDDELKMKVKGRLCSNDKNNPLVNFKILLLNDKFETMDSTMTNNNGDFYFKYVPYITQFSIAGGNNKNIDDAINNILVYDSDENLVKTISYVKGKRFDFKSLKIEQSNLSELYVDDPWLMVINRDKTSKIKTEKITENILFESNKSDLLSQSKQTLDKVILAMQTNKNFTIELGAHSDSKGSDSYNLKLSEQRAIAAKNYIVSKNIDAKRITPKGYGETNLLNNCGNTSICSEDEHAMNRRLEFNLFFN